MGKCIITWCKDSILTQIQSQIFLEVYAQLKFSFHNLYFLFLKMYTFTISILTINLTCLILCGTNITLSPGLK
ncbi:hypothetical protein pb186bvf_019042 [Paramecium bursaria]